MLAEAGEPVTPATGHTSPRLRGEVGSRTVRLPGEGDALNPALTTARCPKAPHPDPLPAGGAREHHTILSHQSPPSHIRQFLGPDTKQQNGNLDGQSKFRVASRRFSE